MDNKYFVVFVLLLISNLVLGQGIVLKGNVFIDNTEENISLKRINVINKNTDQLVETNDKGVFIIDVKLNDILVVKSDFIETRLIKITEAILQKKSVEIHLDLVVIELAEAKIYKPLKPYLEDNIKIVESDKTKFYKSLGLNPEMQFAKVNPYQTSALNNKNYADPTMWISSLSGQRKNDKKVNEYFAKTELLKNLKEYFTEGYFVNSLNIPEHKVDEFINYCYAKNYFKNLVDNYKYEEITNRFEYESLIYLNLINKPK